MAWSDDQDAIPLREARHRTANLFQLVGALGRLRAQHTVEPEAKRQVAWLQDAIAALGVLQRRQLSPDGDDFAGFLTDMAPHWRRRVGALPVVLEIQAESAEVGQQAAAALALVAQELVVNALTHGFPDGRAGQVRVEFKRVDPDRAALCVTDDGIGYDGEAKHPNCLGLWLIRGLTDQLGGALTVDAAAGVATRLEFPLA
jgi:two-component sensor histidine kinase